MGLGAVQGFQERDGLKRIVSDTGPLLHLHEVDALDLLGTAGEVLIPPAVHGELQRLTHLVSPDWLHQRDLDRSGLEEAAAWQDAGFLDPGEAEALSLARTLEVDWFLTDDTAARVVGQSLGLEVHGSLGIILWAAGVSKISGKRAHEILEALFSSSLWVSARLREEARSVLESMLESSAE